MAEAVRGVSVNTGIASYREFAPHDELRDHVRAFFSFVPSEERSSARRRITRRVEFEAGDSFCSPLLADGNASIVLDLGMTCRADGLWQRSARAPQGRVIGPMSRVGPTGDTERAAMVGVYLQPARVSSFMPLPACELTDQVVPLDDLWGASGADLPAELSELNEAARIDRLESELLRRLTDGRGAPTRLNVPGLAAWVLRSRGRLTVECLADAAGVSRQHLTRVFRELVGVPPKLYARLARFQSGLVYAGRGRDVEWARVAAEQGYADQSHMIAEFREFSSLTPLQLATERWFHPFIERAKTGDR